MLSGVEPALNMLRAQLGLPIRMRNAQRVFPATDRHLLPIERARLVERVQAACMPAVLCGISERRRTYYRSLKTFSTFGRGWLSRVDMAQTLAMQLWARAQLSAHD